jgi:hypothetical protein
MMEVALQNPGVEDFVKSFREDSKALLVRRGGNRDGRFLELAVYAEGGRKGLILLPEGREGRGWRCVAGELGRVLTFCKAKTSSLASGFPSPVGKKSEKKVGPGFPPAVVLAKAGAPALGEVM